MVVHSRWDQLNEVKSKKGKDATATMLSPTFWKDVKACLNIFEPLFKVLRLVDGDVKPSMGFLYGELLKAKREIKEACGNVDSRYKEIMRVVDKKMQGRLDSPLHLAAYFLNPYYSYANSSIFDDATVIIGFINCVETFYHDDEDMQDQAVNVELKKFQCREGHFNKKFAKTCVNFDFNPGKELFISVVLHFCSFTNCCTVLIISICQHSFQHLGKDFMELKHHLCKGWLLGSFL